MRILAIESSSLVASVAITTDDILTAEYTVNFKKTHSQTLLPMIEELKKRLELEIDTIDAIAVSGGPGSFTGLRIGSATAKGLGLALDLPLIHIPTLEAMAYNLYGVSKLICPIMDARRGQVYTGLYTFENNNLLTKLDQCAISIEELVEKLNEFNGEVIFLGDGVPVHREFIEEQLKIDYCFAPPHVNRQKASSVAALASIYYNQGKTVSADEQTPDYLRVSQAERGLNELKKNDN